MSTRHVCPVKHMMMIHQHFPRLWYDPYPLHTRGLGLCLFFFSALVYDLRLPRGLFHGSPKAHFLESISVTILTSTVSVYNRLIWCLFYPSLQWGVTIDLWPLRFLVVREIDCGDWLARGYMPAHQHCDLFYPLGWGCDWVYHKLGNAPILRSGTGSWVLSG